MKDEKIAFVASGGGMLCAYGAGVAWALQDSGVRPDIFVGSSGSAGTVSYYACDQADVAAKLWIEEVSNPRVLQRNPLRLDVDFIINSMHQRFPFDEAKLRSMSIDLCLAATDYRTVRTRFFSNHEKLDWYGEMRASMAIPVVYGLQVEIGGRSYFDGDVATTLKACVNLAQQKGATKIYVCDTGFTSYLKSAREIGFKPLVSKDFVKSFIGLTRRIVLDSSLKTHVPVVYLRPSGKLRINPLNNSREAIEEAVQNGYAETWEVLKNIL